MAKHISQGTEYPIFWYGHSYLGAVPAYILSVFFTVFGVSVTSFKIYSFILSVLLTLMTILMVRSLLGNKTAFITAVCLMIPPERLITYPIFDGYHIFLIMGIVFIWQLGIWFKSNNKKWICFLGLTAGFGWYCHPMFSYFIALFMIFLILKVLIGKDRIYFFISSLFSFVIPFMFGAIPYWVALSQNYIYHNPYGSNAESNKFLVGLVYSFFVKLPHILADSGNFFINILCITIYLSIFIFICYRIYKTFIKLKGGSVEPELIFYLLFFTILILVSVEPGYNDLGSTRHLCPLIIVLPVMIAMFIEKIPEKLSYLKFLLIILLVFFNLKTAVARTTADTDYSKILNYLKNQNLTVGYADFWLSYKLVFLTNEDFTISPLWGTDRYEKYTHLILNSENKFYLFDKSVAKQKIMLDMFRENLVLSGLNYTEKSINNFTVFYGLSFEKWGREYPVKYFRPVYEEQLNKKYVYTKKQSKSFGFSISMPPGNYRIVSAVKSDYYPDFPADIKLTSISLMGRKSLGVFCFKSVTNEQFKNTNLVTINVSCVIPSNKWVDFGIYNKRKSIFTKYFIIL